MGLTPIGDFDPHLIAEKRKNILIIYSVFFLVFLLFHGGSERLGIILDLYSLDEVSQYSWPLERILLFVPIAFVVTSIAVFKVRRVLRSKNQHNYNISVHSYWIVDLMTLTGFIGVLTIWSSKISVLYALLLVFAIYAFNRLVKQYDMVDLSKK